uniref:CC-NBS-LRR disease resistance protein n=2 Tax=Cicer arietinum TaxID=3827 RepID=A0A067XTG5_CICAR|nr:putative disease resistance RPP13-like protein 1 [Cicer arietinum]AGT75395.1 CC-NBS-LRR disease resistance protein [Cicer arietinum]
MVQTFQAYSLQQLSDEDCWSVFANHACFSQEKSTQNMDLEKIGKEIVRKCKGLPLAAQSLGGLLRRKRDIRDWNNLLNSNIWEIDEKESKIIPALRISYHYLPPYLKRCFVYCCLYPKDYKFDEEGLILLWMAEDLLQPRKNGKTLEEVGYEYFNDLASIFFFQRSRSGNSSRRFVMHDLVHDLATLIGAEFYFRTEELGKETNIGNKTRHLSFNNLSELMADNFEIFDRAKYLRTVLTIDFRHTPFNHEKELCIILLNLKCLRVLSFQRYEYLNALPNSIGELIHLRYLDLSSTTIKTLPESLCNLYNLQTFKLCGCFQLTKLPNGMQKLVNLRYLDIRFTLKLEDIRFTLKLGAFREMSEKGLSPSVVCYTSLIHGMCQSNNLDEAIGLLEDMTRNGIEPNVFTYSSLMDGLCKCGHSSHAMELLEVMVRKRHLPNMVTYSTLINGLCKESKLREAVEILDRMRLQGLKPNVEMYGKIISGLCAACSYQEAANFVNEMVLGDISPTRATWSFQVRMHNKVVQGLCNNIDPPRAFQLYLSMRTRAISVENGTFDCLVKCFCKRGNLHKAPRVLEEMIFDEASTIIDLTFSLQMVDIL